MRKQSGCFPNVFMICSLLLMGLTIAYRIFFYASYLYIDDTNVVFEWEGGENNIWVNTDSRSWIIEDTYCSWASFYISGNYLYIYVDKNTNKEDRSCAIKIRSGYNNDIGQFVDDLFGSNTDWITVTQKGKQASYLDVSKSSIAFSKYGGSESLKISTDGDIWTVVECPNWITKSITGNKLTFYTDANNNAFRQGVVKIKSDNIVKTINVSQEPMYVLSISSIDIANIYKDGTIETNYGNTIYSSYTMYLKPRIHYYGYKSGWVTLYIKLYTPYGLSTGSSSPSGYTTRYDVYIYEGYNTADLTGWGGERKGYWSSGQYCYEIYLDDKFLNQKYFYIY